MIVIYVIIISSLKMIIDTYAYQINNEDVKTFLLVIDYLVNFTFIIECIIKVVAQGFIMDEGSYLRDSWS